MHRQECDLGRTEPKPQGVIQIEILQRVGADCGLCALRSLAFPYWNKFRRNLRCQDSAQGLRDVVAELARRDDPPDQMLNQRLWDAGVYVVVGHLIPYSVSAPSERQFRKIARANDDAPVMVCQTEEIISPHSRLNVLERDVINGLAFTEG